MSIGHASPEAASGGAIGLVRDGDIINIDIPNRAINLEMSNDELAARRAEQDQKVGSQLTVSVKSLSH